MRRKTTAAILAAMLTISLTACAVSGAQMTDSTVSAAEFSSSDSSSEDTKSGSVAASNSKSDSTSSKDSESDSASSGTGSDSSASSKGNSDSSASSDTGSGTSSDSGSDSKTDSETAQTAVSMSDDDMFKKKDIDTSYSDEVTITLKDGASAADGSGVSIEGDTVTITEPGTYLLTGTLSDGRVIVDADSEETVHLILDNVSISNNSGAAVCSLSTDKLIITTADGSENTLAGTGEYEQTDDSNVDAAIFSKTDLSLNGEGLLTVSSAYGHGIVSKDDLVITSGNYEITAAKCGLSGKDSIRIGGGSFDIEAGTDALHSENTEDEGKGFIYIAGGTFDISCDDDAMHTSGDLTIKDGEFDIEESYEGLEGLTVTIDGGILDITSSDDGINATDGNGGNEFGMNGMPGFPMNNDQNNGAGSGMSSNGGGNAGTDIESNDNDIAGSGSSTDENDTSDSDMASEENREIAQESSGIAININGGTITLNTGGDSLDSNGSLSVTGGTILINGPTDNGNGVLDYDGAGTITGGTIIAAGSSGMAMNFGTGSTQGSILQNLSGTQAAGTEVTLKDADGKELLSFTPEKSFSGILISSPDLKVGNTYTLTVGTETYSIELTDTIYGAGAGGMGGMNEGMPGGMNEGAPGGMNGGMPGGMNGDRPNEMDGSGMQGTDSSNPQNTDGTMPGGMNGGMPGDI